MKINVDAKEFADIVACFLLDKLLYPDKVIFDNEDFNELAEIMKGKGMRSFLLNYYLGLSALTRTKYKYIKKSLTYDTDEISIIYIQD
jgi:hypothetical protein